MRERRLVFSNYLGSDHELMPCNEEKERKGKIEDPSGRDFSAKKKQGEVVVTLGLTW